MKITILGSGAAGGVPSLSRGWGACDPTNPKNRRSRPSILLETELGRRILIDTSPDCRSQLLAADVNALDAVLYTHDHADHLHGIDDLREINRVTRTILPIYGSQTTLNSIKERFPYVVGEVESGQTIYKPMLDLTAVSGPFEAAGLEMTAFDQDHGYCRTTGYRFGAAAYSTDVVDLPESSFDVLSGVETWIIGCLTYDPHPTHAHLDKVLAWIDRIKPRTAYLTHMTPSMDYDVLLSELPANVMPAYDGLAISV